MHCQLCEYKFRKAAKLTEHMVACHDQGKVTKNLTVAEEFNCSLCNFSTNTSFNLVQHQSKVHTEKAEKDGNFNCGHCPFRAGTLNAIKSHRYLTHFQKNLEEVGFDITQLVSCIVCSAQFSGRDRLRSHLLDRHNMDPTIPGTGRTGGMRYFSCAYCEASFQYLSKLETHEKTCHSGLPSQIHHSLEKAIYYASGVIVNFWSKFSNLVQIGNLQVVRGVWHLIQCPDFCLKRIL